MAKAFNFVAWVDKNVCCAVHTVVPKLDAPSSFVKGARAAKKSRFTSLKTVAEELELETEDEDCALLLEDLALELLEDSAEELETAELLDATDRSC